MLHVTVAGWAATLCPDRGAADSRLAPPRSPAARGAPWGGGAVVGIVAQCLATFGHAGGGAVVLDPGGGAGRWFMIAGLHEKPRSGITGPTACAVFAARQNPALPVSPHGARCQVRGGGLSRCRRGVGVVLPRGRGCSGRV